MPPLHHLSVNSKTILKELSEHNSFFDSVVNMIPAKLYVSGNTGDEMYNPKYMKGQHKESKEARRGRNKIAKMNKFNPDLRESTLDEKKRIEAEQFEADSSDDDNDGKDQIQDNHEEEDEEMKPDSSGADKSSSFNPNLSRIEQLKAKLRAKLEEQRSQRPAGNSDTMVSKRAARRAEKNRKIELAKKRQANPSSGTTQTGRNKGKITIVKELGGSTINGGDKEKTVNGDLSGIDFGGIAGLQNDLTGNYTEANKSLKNKGKKKSLDKLLAEAEAKKERLRQLKESEDAEDKEKAKKIIWGDTLKEARYDFHITPFTYLTTLPVQNTMSIFFTFTEKKWCKHERNKPIAY